MKHIQRQAAGLRLLRGQLHVFDKMLKEKPRRIIPRDDLGAEGIQLLAAGCAGGHGPEQGRQIQPLGLGISDGLTNTGECAADHDLIGQFGMLAAAGLPLIVDIGSHGPEHRQAGLIVLPVTTHQNGQCPSFGTGVTAGDRRIQHPQAPLLSTGIDPLRQGGAGSGHVDQVSALFRRIQDISRSKIDLLHILGKPYNGDHHRTLGHTGGNASVKAGTLLHHVGYLLRMACINMELISGLHKIAHHGLSHNAYANKADLFHLSLSFIDFAADPQPSSSICPYHVIFPAVRQGSPCLSQRDPDFPSSLKRCGNGFTPENRPHPRRKHLQFGGNVQQNERTT